METTTTVAERVTAAISEVDGLLVEVPGETREARFQRVRRLSVRLENLACGYDVWTPESKALSAAVGRVFRFRAWGAK